MPRFPRTSRAASVEPLESRRLLSAAAHDTTSAAFVAAASLPAKQMENLGRGIVAVRTSTTVYVGWRLLGTDPANVAFNVYRSANGAAPVKRNGTPITATTDFIDSNVNFAQSNAYTVRPVINGVEGPAGAAFTLAANVASQQFLNVPLQIPPGGTVPDHTNPLNPPIAYTYSANDASVGDLDADGEYEIVLKWDPSNSKDNAQDGYTGNVYIDAYKLNGTRLWRIDLGRNIRAGAHYTQFIVYDLDGDGKAEVAMKTADGTVSGTGQVIGDANADYRNSSGRILSGPEFLTVFNGRTGAAMATMNFQVARGNISSWGDNYGNRGDRFLATVAYLDGQRPSLIMARGYYARSTLTAWDWRGGTLSKRWTFDTDDATPDPDYRGQGNHNLAVGDVDGDGKDEIVYGAATIDDDGTGLYSTGLGHGDAMHLSDMIPSRPGLEVFQVHESPSAYGTTGGTLRDAATGELIVGMPTSGDVGRGNAFDIDPNHSGYEIWNSSTPDIYAADGRIIQPKPSNMFMNFGVWWDRDPLRELLDGTTISDWRIGADGTGGRFNYVFGPANVTSNNGTKATPSLSGDILGDWREEVIWRRSDNTALQIWTTTIASDRRIYTLMHDPVYRVAIAHQNTGYNQPPHPGFFLGEGMSTPPAPNIYLADGTAPPPADPNTYPAEDGSIGGGSVLEANNGGFNGAGYVNFSPADGFLQFDTVDGGATNGIRTIAIRYALGAAAPRAGRLLVNGVAQEITFATTGAWTAWQTISLNVPLGAGATNTIRFESTGQDLANIDEIRVDLAAKTGSITGRAFHDTNGNGLDASEPALSGVIVYIDGNANAARDAGEIATVTDGGGNYWFAGLPDGDYTIGAVAPAQFVTSHFGQATVSGGAADTDVNVAHARINYVGTSAAEQYELRMSAAGKYEILIGGSLAYAVFAAAPSLTFDLAGGDDTFTIDLVNGAPAPAGGLSVDGGAGADAISVRGTAGDDVVQFAASSVSLTGASIAHSGVEHASFDGGGGWDDLGASGASVAIAIGQRFDSLSLDAGAMVTLPAGDSVLVTRSLVLSGAARLDLADNDLLIDYATGESPYAQVRQYVLDGLSTTPTGITSAPGDGTVLAVSEKSVFGGGGEWNGVPVDDTTIIGKYTYYGDANLDGQVTTDDYVAVDLGLGTGTSWVQGDVDYNGQVTTDDYVVIDLNLGKGADAPLTSVNKPTTVADGTSTEDDEQLVELIDEQPPVGHDKNRRTKVGSRRR